jgi:beta-phosphoglucomutase-like phosphatase (HAD superfamily)
MKAIIFDMDGVLVDAMPFHYEAMRKELRIN